MIEVIDWKYSTYFGQRDVHLLAHELVAVRFRFIFRTVFIRQIVTFGANCIGTRRHLLEHTIFRFAAVINRSIYRSEAALTVNSLSDALLHRELSRE